MIATRYGLKLNPPMPQGVDPDQRSFDFNPIEATPEESERQRREIVLWTREEAEEGFHPLPGEPMSEFYAARELYLQELDTFGPLFPREPCEAWQIVQGQRHPFRIIRAKALKIPTAPVIKL
jgi:hypothetical protein